MAASTAVVRSQPATQTSRPKHSSPNTSSKTDKATPSNTASGISSHSTQDKAIGLLQRNSFERTHGVTGQPQTAPPSTTQRLGGLQEDPQVKHLRLMAAQGVPGATASARATAAKNATSSTDSKLNTSTAKPQGEPTTAKSEAVAADPTKGPDDWCGARVDSPWAASRGWKAYQSTNPDAPRGAVEMRSVDKDGTMQGDLYVPNVPNGYRRWDKSGGRLHDPHPETPQAPDEWCGKHVANSWAEKRGFTAFEPKNPGPAGALEMRVTDPLGKVHGALYVPDAEGGYKKHAQSGGDIELYDPLGANSPSQQVPSVDHVQTKPSPGAPKNHVANSSVDVNGSCYTVASNYANGSISVLDPDGKKVEFRGQGVNNSGFPDRCAAPDTVVDGDKVHVFYTSFDGEQKDLSKAWGENPKTMKRATIDTKTGEISHTDVTFDFKDGKAREVIDAEVYKNPKNGRYYMLSSEITAPQKGWKSHLCWSSADSLDGPWSDPKPLKDSSGSRVDQRFVNAAGQVEAPGVVEAPCIDTSSKGDPKLYWSVGPCIPAEKDPIGTGSAPTDPASYYPDTSAVRHGSLSFDDNGEPTVQVDNALILSADGIKSMATHPDVAPDGTLHFYAKFEDGDNSYYQAVTRE